MAKLIFRCVETRMNVQVWLPDAAPTDRADSYESVTCPACTRLHVGSSRVDLQACKLEYSIVSPK